MRKHEGRGGAVVAAAAVAPYVTPSPVGPKGGVSGSSARGRGEEKVWSVMMEKCYVMVSCHRNHPVMYKVRGEIYRPNGGGTIVWSDQINVSRAYAEGSVACGALHRSSHELWHSTPNPRYKS